MVTLNEEHFVNLNMTKMLKINYSESFHFKRYQTVHNKSCQPRCFLVSYRKHDLCTTTV